MYTAKPVGVLFNKTSPGTGDLLAEITPSEYATAIRVTVAVGTASTLLLAVTQGSTVVTAAFNSGVALNAAALYTFTASIAKQDQSGNVLTYNLRLGTDVTVSYLSVEELQAEVV